MRRRRFIAFAEDHRRRLKPAIPLDALLNVT